MKKIILTLAILSALVCLLAFSVSAEVTTYTDAPQRTKYTVSTDDVVVFKDGFTCPSGYIFKDQQTIPAGGYNRPATFPSCVDFEYINGKTEKVYTVEDIVAFDIPQGITFVGLYAFKDNTHIKRVSFPDSVTSLGNAIFQNATGLEECIFEHGEDSDLKTFPGYMFAACPNLKAFSMPDSITETKEVAHFAGCTNLGAVYLSKNLQTLTSGVQNSATFNGCNNMYFVNEPFTTSDTAPDKPTVYYFPKKLGSLPNECIFRYCNSLNDVLVFGEGVTSVPQDCTFQNNTKNTVIFLGDMTNVNSKYWGTTTVIFANKADKSTSDVATLVTSQKVIFCNADGNTEHFAEKTVDEEAKCEVNAGKVTYCFCGARISKEEISGTALSHDYDYVNGNATLVAVIYKDLSMDGTKTVTCGICGVDNNTIKADKVFNYLGYSKDGKGGFCMGYLINQEALKDYESKNGSVVYGFIASANNDTPLDASGNKEENVVQTVLTDSGYTAIDFILTAENWEDEAVASAKITLNMYVIVNNAVQYITQNGYSTTAEAYKYSEI